MPAFASGRPPTERRSGVAFTRRRRLLAGAGGLVLAACGSRTTEDSASTTTTVDDETLPTTPPENGSEAVVDAERSGGLTIPLTFLSQQPVGEEVRLPLSLADAQGARLTEPPGELVVRVGPSGGDLGPPTTVTRHDRGIPQAYFPLRTTFDESGTWRIVADADGARAETAVNAVPPAELGAFPGPGDRLVSVPTPTRRRHQGVDPICTADPICPLHDVSLADALDDAERPVALLIGTPAFCQTGICGPVLDLLLDEHDRLGDAVAMIHAEVYTDPSMNDHTEAVTFHALPFEPVLFLASPDGTVVDRLDLVYDADELRGALDQLVV